MGVAWNVEKNPGGVEGDKSHIYLSMFIDFDVDTV